MTHFELWHFDEEERAMVVNHNDAAPTDVMTLPNRRVENLDDYAAAVRAFLAAGSGRSNRPPRSRALGSSSGIPARGQRPALELPCQRHDPSLWFAEGPAELDRAKALCAQCPIRLACLAVAVDRAEFAGVWGGHIFDRGRILAHKRARGRPRKHPTHRPHTPDRGAAAPEENAMTKHMPEELRHGPAEVRAAAARLYDAECALHSAHQTHVDTWIDAANQRLHAAVSDYLDVATSSGLDLQDRASVAS